MLCVAEHYFFKLERKESPLKKDLKLSDRIFRCDCGYIEDRDFNAALNLRDATTYEVA